MSRAVYESKAWKMDRGEFELSRPKPLVGYSNFLEFSTRNEVSKERHRAGTCYWAETSALYDDKTRAQALVDEDTNCPIRNHHERKANRLKADWTSTRSDKRNNAPAVIRQSQNLRPALGRPAKGKIDVLC